MPPSHFRNYDAVTHVDCISFSMKAYLLLVIAAVAGCAAAPPQVKETPARASVDVTRQPAETAECIRRHAQAAGLFADVQPVFGYEHLAVRIAASTTADDAGWLLVGRSNGATHVDLQRGPEGTSKARDNLLEFARGC